MISSKCCASIPSPVPRLMARSMLSFGMLWARAERIALRSRALPLGSPPPVFAAIVISRESLLKSAPRLVSSAPLNRLTFDHLLCPDMRLRIPVKLPDRPVFFREPESLEGNRYRGGKLTGKLNRSRRFLSISLRQQRFGRVSAQSGRGFVCGDEVI